MSTNASNNKSSSNCLQIFTDGATSNNGKLNARAGFGVYFVDDISERISVAVPNHFRQTNNVAELLAIQSALEWIQSHVIELLANNQYVVIYTDSQYSINCLTKWIHTWIANGWVNSKRKKVENDVHIKCAYNLLHDLQKSIRIELVHVRAHKTPPSNKNTIAYLQWYGNHIADQLAVAATHQS